MAHTIDAPNWTKPAAVRIVTGSPVAAESTTLTDENFSPVPVAGAGGPVSLASFATVSIAVELFNGSTQLTAGEGTVTIDPLFRSPDSDNGFAWKQQLYGASATNQNPFKPQLDAAGGFVEIRVDGQTWFFRIDSVTGTFTRAVILVRPGQPIIGTRTPQ